MTTAAEAFLALEKSLANRLLRQWERDIAGPLARITAAVNRGDFAAALDECPNLSMRPAAERNRRFIEFIGMQATIFGASRLTRGHPKRTMFAQEGATQPKEVGNSSNGIVEMLGKEGTEEICRVAARLIDAERTEQQEAAYKSDETVRKAATDNFIRAFTSSVNRNGGAYINIGSSLHTSRLSSWGFTQEANFRGISQYQVSEQLDTRTCPVCRTLHGRKFAVAPAAARLENVMNILDIAELKSAAPFPKQNAKNITRLSKMSRSELQQNGWDTPPYHPLCRGILVPEGAVPEKLPVDDPLVDSFIEGEQITESLREEIEDLAAQVVGNARIADDFVTPQVVEIAEQIGATFPSAVAPGAPHGAEEVVSGSLRYYRLKGKGSSARKILTYQQKYELPNASMAAERLSDSLRYTYVLDEADYVAGVKATMERFRDLGYRNGKFDAAWFTRPDYKGINVNLVTPQGVKMELQFHTPASFDIKQNINHVLYEKYRTLPKAKQRGPEGAAIQKQMKDNADGIPIPLNIELLEELTKLYNGTG